MRLRPQALPIALRTALLAACVGAAPVLAPEARGELVPVAVATDSPWSFEFEQVAWSPLRSFDAAKAAVSELRGPRWLRDAGFGSADAADGLQAYDLDAGIWWNQSVGAVVSARVIDDLAAAGPQAMLADALAAWRVAGSGSGAIDILAGARVAAGVDADAAGRQPGIGTYQSESALVAGVRARSQVARGVTVGLEGDVAPRVSGAGVAWKVGAGAEVDLGANWSMSVDAGWRTLDAALNDAVGGVAGRSEGAVWIGFSKRF